MLLAFAVACSSVSDDRGLENATASNFPPSVPTVVLPSAPAASVTGQEGLADDEVRIRGEVFSLGRFHQQLPLNAICPVYKPEFVAAEDAGLIDEELVLGVAINGESKAYPIGPLNRREMVDDELGGIPILVTW